jgi:tRNA A-37 threonylcarbamoyl transferase component Bud32
MQEFALLLLMRSWGLHVPEPMGAQVHQHGCWQRCDIAVAWIPGSRNLVQRLNEGPLSDWAWAQVGQAVRQLHDHQVHHSDLNAHNIMIDEQGQVWLVDFDKCERRAGEDWKAENLARLLRSFKKEKQLQGGLHLTDPQWAALLNGYQRAS